MAKHTNNSDGKQGSDGGHRDAVLGELMRRYVMLGVEELEEVLDVVRNYQHEPQLRVVPKLRVVGTSSPSPEQPPAETGPGTAPVAKIGPVAGKTQPADLDFPDKPDESCADIQGQIVGLAMLRHKVIGLSDELEGVMPGWVGRMLGTPEQRMGWIGPLNHLGNAGDELLTVQDRLCAGLCEAG